MERDEVEELQYITHVDNIASIAERGILSHRWAGRVAHVDVSLAEVQDRRKSKRIPGGLLLHDYANAYLTARNPMLFKRISEGMLDELCVVRVSSEVLELEGVVMSDRNAAASFCRFQPPEAALPAIDVELVERVFWTDGSQLERELCWNAKFIEVLVPQRIPAEHLIGAYVGSSDAHHILKAADCGLAVEMNRHLFFDR